MAGHSKWANIQHRKKRQDAKRVKLFTRLIREITVAAREGGGDQDSNPRLRLALDKAFSSNMNKDTIEKAINRGIGKIEGAIYEEITYEGYSSNGVAVLVETVTDNRNQFNKGFLFVRPNNRTGRYILQNVSGSTTI